MITPFLFHPVKYWFITQYFGENKVCTDIATLKKFVYKETHQTCPVGFKSVYSQMKGHNGLDVAAKRWQPCYALQDGVVTEVSTEEARGLGVSVLTNEKYFCQETGKFEYFIYRCWHFIGNAVHIGDKVEVGTLLGYCDSTGYSTSDHLHIELKPVKKTDDKGGTVNLLQDNGYFGAVDPLPYMEDVYALDFAGIYKQFKELTARVTDWIGDRLRK